MRPQEYETMFHAEEVHWWYKALHRLIFITLDEQLPAWREKDILDAGCGTGAILHRLGNAEKHRGLDIAEEAISFCRQRGLRNVREGDICELPFPDECFDAAICSSVLYHQWVRDIDLALSELRRVLRPGGILLVNLPAYDFLASAHDEAVMTARRFRKREVQSLLAENGFAVRSVNYWTALLFPAAVIARTLHASQTGRDFGAAAPRRGLLDGLFSFAMRAELPLMKRFSLPFGVAIFAIATKPHSQSRGAVT